MKTRYLTAMIILLQISKSLPSQFVQVKPTMSYLEKGMTGFHKYTPQRPHAEIYTRSSQILQGGGANFSEGVHILQ